MRRKVFELLMKEAENDLLVLQKEACVLQAEVDAGADTEAELQSLKQQWLMKEKILCMLATRNSVTCRKKIKQLRVTLKYHIMRNKRAAKIPPVILSCTRKGHPVHDVLKEIRYRRASFSRRLSKSPHSLLEEAMTVHKQAFTILKDINILVRKVQKISKMRQEVTSLKKAVGDMVEFLESNRSLIIDFFSMVTLPWEAMKARYPQECSKVYNNTDVQSALNSLNTQDGVQKAQEETHINDADIKRCQGSYKDDDRTQVTNIPKAKPVLQNGSIGTDYDTDAIFEEYKIVSPISKFDEDSVLSEAFDFMENDLGHVRDYLPELNDVETDVLEEPNIHSYEEDNTQFRSNASGVLIAFAAYKHGPSNACLKTADNSTANRKQTCTFHMEGCNLPAKQTNDDENAVATDYSVQEACDPSVGLWPWADQFSEGCIPNDNDIQHLNWEWSEIFKIL